jgi:hypothetical protein
VQNEHNINEDGCYLVFGQGKALVKRLKQLKRQGCLTTCHRSIGYQNIKNVNNKMASRFVTLYTTTLRVRK